MTTLNITGAAEVLKVHPNRILEMIHDGRLPAARIGRAWVLMERDVVDYVERQIMVQTQQRRLGKSTPAGRRAA